MCVHPLPLPDRYSPRSTAEAPALSAVPAPVVDDVPAGTHGTIVLEGLPLLRRPEVAPLRPAGPEHQAGAHTRSGNAMGRTRRGLLAGAAVAFAEHGLRRATMQHVAAAAGVAKATLYNHFRTKDDVAAALLEAELDRLTALAAAGPRGRALGGLAEEVADHAVLRRLTETEPELLARLLCAVDDDALTDRLAGALRLDRGGAGLVLRWLVGLACRPGTTLDRARQADALDRAL